MDSLPLNRPTAALGEQNAVLRARARRHFVKDYAGPLSIKCVTEGTVAWKTGGRDLPVDRGSFLVLNAGEPYSLNIDSGKPVATLCVFFEAGFVESVRGAMEGGEIEGGRARAEFAERLHRADERIVPRMHALAAGCSRLRLDEEYLALACDLLRLDRDFARRLRLMPERKAATRDELFRRVQRGQEYLHANAEEDLRLATLAREAGLSAYHFQRTFTRVFGVSPLRYRNTLRLERARALLQDPAESIAGVCRAVGFQSTASFSLLFRRTFGAPPSSFRK